MKVTANRVVLALNGIFIVLTAVGAYVATTSNSLPKKWQDAAAGGVVIIGALAAGTAATIKFLDGSQKYDALVANSADKLNVPGEPTDEEIESSLVEMDESEGTPASEIVHAGFPGDKPPEVTT